jgi:tripartite-type tricarboxylate transporter receptor subunit TctC
MGSTRLLCSTINIAIAFLLSIGPAAAQDKFPSKVIRIMTAAPGSNHDWGARLSASELTPRIGQRVIVENRGSISVEIAAKDASTDGHTLLFYGAYVWLQPLLQKVNWDPLTDLAPITLAMSSPNVLVVHPSLPVTSVKEMIALAKARPGELNYSAGGGGSTQHIAAELLKYLADVRITRIYYKGAGPALMGMLTGEVHVMFAAVGPVLPHIKQGKVRPLAVSTPKRTPLLPDLPPVADTVPGFAAEATIGFFAPRKTPAAIIAILNREIVQALKGADPKVVAGAGIEIVGSTPEEFAQFIQAEMARVGKVIKSASFTS